MDASRSWEIIDSTTVAADDLERQSELLTDRLTRLSVDDLLSFDAHYTEASHALYTWQVWRAADIMIGDASDDVFADFRSWVISRGSTAHAAVLADVDSGLAALDVGDIEEVGAAELFGAVIDEVYSNKTGQSIFDAFEDRPSADFPDGEPAGPDVPGSRAERRQHFPLLSAAYAPSQRPWPFRLASSIRFPWRD